MYLRTMLHAARRHKVVFSFVFVLGLIAGAAFTLIRPPMLTSTVLVIIPGTKFIQTEAVIAGSDPVLARAGKILDPDMSAQTLRTRTHVTTVTSTVLSIAAKGTTGVQAQNIANAVAHSYVAFVKSPNSPGGRVAATIVASATPATGTALHTRLIETTIFAALPGTLLGAIIVTAIGRTDRRLRQRDEIAGAIGAPVLASIPVMHSSDTASWARLLAEYEPGAIHAWGLRKALRHVGVADMRLGFGGSVTLAVVSLSSDRRALAVGPQLAVFAASLGIPTTLVIGRQQGSQTTAALSAACAKNSGDPSRLHFYPGGHPTADTQEGGALTVTVTVIDSANARVTNFAPATATVFAVSAGAVTAEQLARVAVSITGDGRDIAGVVVADPDPADRTTGRLAELNPPNRGSNSAQHRQNRQPGRVTSAAAEGQP